MGAQVVKSSLTSCNGNADCGGENEVCGAFVFSNEGVGVNSNNCVVSDYCNALGK